MCVGGRGEREESEGERERETGGLLQTVRVFFSPIYFVSCNGLCALKEKWHRKEHIIIIIISACNYDL